MGTIRRPLKARALLLSLAAHQHEDEVVPQLPMVIPRYLIEGVGEVVAVVVVPTRHPMQMQRFRRRMVRVEEVEETISLPGDKDISGVVAEELHLRLDRVFLLNREEGCDRILRRSADNVLLNICYTCFLM